MKFKGELRDCVKTFGGGFILTISTKQDNLPDETINALKSAKNGLKIDVTQWREPRSLNANAYSWKLQSEIAEVLGLGIDEVHERMVLEYGVTEVYSISKEALESATRTFEYFKVLGEGEVNGKIFVHVRAGLGTHLYDTKEMARFIDGVVQEAEQLGIQTETPDKIAEMKSLWREHEEHITNE